MTTEIVRAATFIHAPYDTVWTSLTRPDRQADWYVAPCLAFGWERGDRVAWGQLDMPVIEGRLIDWEPASRFSHTFEFTAFSEPESFVEWEVLAMGEVVWVEVKHHFPREAIQTQAIITDGWTTVLARLKTLLETGQIMPWPEQEEIEGVD